MSCKILVSSDEHSLDFHSSLSLITSMLLHYLPAVPAQTTDNYTGISKEVIRKQSGVWTAGDSTPSKSKTFLLLSAQTPFGTHPTSYSRAHSPSWPITFISPRGQETRSCISNPQCGFMASCLLN
jgi:hypothetical protein